MLEAGLEQSLDKIAGFNEPYFAQLLRGIEKENLRVDPFGAIALSPHPRALGKALTHPSITTDFSESLPEVITEPIPTWPSLKKRLTDISAYLVHHLSNSEMLWPCSMPPAVESDDDVVIADYGKSHVGRLKHLYRIGLSNRYGKMMQVIAGLHYNFSFPEALLKRLNPGREISDWYFILMRNFYRHYCVLPYLFGASPACDKSLLRGREISTALEPFLGDTLIGPYATSLRMSDIGYQNQSQAQICISTDNVKSYCQSLSAAMQQNHAPFEAIGFQEGDRYRQLNTHLLQIENEYYSPIRPKQVAKPLERPSHALCTRGVQYIEVRVLDLNPLNQLAIDKAESGFLDVFLSYCALSSDKRLDKAGLLESKANFKRVVCQGRNPALKLQISEKDVPFYDYCETLFESLRAVAHVMDRSLEQPYFARAVEKQWQKVEDVALTPSQQVFDIMKTEGLSHQAFGLKMAKLQQAEWEELILDPVFLSEMEAQTQQSIRDERAAVTDSLGHFDDYLRRFNEKKDESNG